jgi:type I restriction enzyme S subunit
MEAAHKPIGELLDAVPRQPKIKRSAYQDSGRYPIVDQSQSDIAGYTDDESWLYQGELPVVIFGDHTRVLKLVNFPFCVGADGTQLLRPVAGNDIRYFYYALRNVDLTNYGYERHFKYLKEEEIPVPPLPLQRRIAGILSAYDELMENSQRRIRLLEAMARALYREWFVHFRFPGHEKHPRVPSPLGDIPQGWEVKLVKDILSRRAAGMVYREEDVKVEGTIPVLDQSTNELLGFHDNEPDHLASPTMPMAIFGDHTCKMQLLIEPFSVGPNVVPFAAVRELPTAYVFFAVNSLVQTQEYKRHWIPLNAKEVIVANRVLAQRFASLIQPMLVEQATLRKAIRNFRRTRDLLLPRLLSGQVELETEAA